MKILLTLFIAAVAIQLSLAAPTTTAPDTTSSYHKRYQLFDSILLKINEVTSNELMHMASAYSNILKDYNDWLQDHKDDITGDNGKLHQELKENLENFIKIEENLTKDRHNCELQRKMQNIFFALGNKLKELNNREINEIWKRHKPNIDEEEEKDKLDFINNYFPILTADVENFLNTLDNTGKEENKNLIKWFNKLQSTNVNEEKLEAFDEIEDLFGEELERETMAGEVNCRLLILLEWREELLKSLLRAMMNAAFVAKPKIEADIGNK